MANPKRIRELLYINRSSTANTAFTDPDQSAWTSTATRIPLTAHDPSGLEYVGEENPQIQTRRHRSPANIPTIRQGSYKAQVLAEGGSTTTSPPALFTLLKAAFGGLHSPSSKTGTAGASSGTRVVSSSANPPVGSAVKIGVAGDGEGNGEIFEVVETNANEFYLDRPAAGAISNGAALNFCHTLYLTGSGGFDYVDFTAIGDDTTSPDQHQGIAACMKVELADLDMGSLPKFDIELMPLDWRPITGSNIGTINRNELTWGSAPTDIGRGAFFIQTSGSETRNALDVSDVALGINLEYAPIKSPNGVNGKVGWVKMPSTPTLSFKTYYGDTDAMPGLWNSFSGSVDKSIMFQCGKADQRSMAVSLQRATVTKAPSDGDIEGLSAVSVEFKANECPTIETDLQASALRIHAA